ncbi:MAG: hypothetical protein DCC58_11005 [Chloroflexi bacterium]|nr:MAG: hypothetical protein DCC58_11005 [Chloroflexota bacterium]
MARSLNANAARQSAAATAILDVELIDQCGVPCRLPQTCALVILYRGYFCPLCREHLERLRELAWRFRTLRVPLIAVSADGAADVARMANLLGDSISVLGDPQLRLIDALGVRNSDDEIGRPIAHPAAFGLGSNGNIRYRFIGRNPSDRPTIDLLLLAAERLAIGRD